MLIMSFRGRSLAAFFCLGLGLSGCASMQESVKTEGSFTTGGSGQYGQPAGSTPTVSGGLFAGKKKTVSTLKPETKVAYARLAEQRKDTAEARRWYSEVLAAQDAKSLDARIDAMIGLARLDHVAGKTEAAIQQIHAAIAIDQKSGRALDALGQIYAEQNRWNEALPALERALARAPEDKTIRFHYAVALAKTGQTDNAMPHFVESVGNAAANYNIGLVMHEQGNLEAAEDRFAAAILENPRLEAAQKWLELVQREQQGDTRHADAQLPQSSRTPSPVQHATAIVPAGAKG
jgi:tetratricopeptide (TPR) repeat protein